MMGIQGSSSSNALLGSGLTSSGRGRTSSKGSNFDLPSLAMGGMDGENNILYGATTATTHEVRNRRGSKGFNNVELEATGGGI